MHKVDIPLNCKRLTDETVLPKYAHPGDDAGADLTAVSYYYDEKYDVYIYDTALAVSIPKNHFGMIVPRSSIYKTGLMLVNHCGIIDYGYTGSIRFMFRHVNKNLPIYKAGDKIGQLIIVPFVSTTPKFVDNLEDSQRGTNGFGSTGR